MQEQVLQARLQDVYVGEFHSVCSRRGRDFGDERASTIGVDVRAQFVVFSQLAYDGQRL
jgi:hypothetical protein